MSTHTTAEPTMSAATRAPWRRFRLDIIAWALLVALSAVPLFGAVMDLVADTGGTLPADHVAAFRAASGATATTIVAAETGAGLPHDRRHIRCGVHHTARTAAALRARTDLE